MASAAQELQEKTDRVDVEYRRLEKRQSFKEKIVAQLGGDAFRQNVEKPDHRVVDSSSEPRLQTCRSFTEKMLSIQSLTHPGPDSTTTTAPPSKKIWLQIRVAKARVQCHRHFLNGCGTIEEDQIAESRHDLAQKTLIAKTLRRSDHRRRRPRRRLIFRFIRKENLLLSPIMACLQWLREPLVRLARVASTAAAKMELHQSPALRDRRNATRVTCFPLADVHNLPLLTSDPFLD